MDQILELACSLSITGPCSLGQRADGLYQVEQFLAFLAAKDLPEEFTQELDVLAQGGVLIGGVTGHGWILPRLAGRSV